MKASQNTPPSPGQSDKGPVPIPVAVGLLGQDGTELPLTLKVCTTSYLFCFALEFRSTCVKACPLQWVCRWITEWWGVADQGESGEPETTKVLLLTEKEQEFVFTEVSENPVPSLLRDFSAPVKLEVRICCRAHGQL